MKKILKIGIYKNIKYESIEELNFLQWLWELKDRDFIKSIERSPSFKLSDAIGINYEEVKQLKTKSKTIVKTLDVLREHVYTPEFEVWWNSLVFIKSTANPNGLFYNQHLLVNSFHTFFEIKPQFDQNNMSRLFKINQKWLYAKKGVFVNLIVPQKLFKETFTPKEYLLTPTGKPKKINWKIVTCDEWLNKTK